MFDKTVQTNVLATGERENSPVVASITLTKFVSATIA